MSFKAFTRAPERKAKGQSRAGRWGVFALGAVLGTIFGITLTQVAGPDFIPTPRTNESLVGRLVNLAKERGSQAEVMAGSIEEAQKSEAQSPVLVPVAESKAAPKVPAMLTSHATALPDISGLPAKEVFTRCAPDVHPATTAWLAARMSAGNVWSVGLVGGQVYAASTYSTAVRLIESWRKEGRNFNVGLMQMNPALLARFGLSAEEALEPCTNLHAAQNVLTDLWVKESASLPASPQLALLRTLDRFMALNFRAVEHEADAAQSAMAEQQGTPLQEQIPTTDVREERTVSDAAPSVPGMVF